MDRVPEVAVVGAGIVSLCTAYALAERGTAARVYESGVPRTGNPVASARRLRLRVRRHQATVKMDQTVLRRRSRPLQRVSSAARRNLSTASRAQQCLMMIFVSGTPLRHHSQSRKRL
ncbi:FAD-dependent oxidoreductase [Streptomyces sp. NPDC003730]